MVPITLLPTNLTLYLNNYHRKHNKLIKHDYRTEDIYANIKTFHSEPPPPIYNMRHIHPVRQSGPIPPYDGPWTMEDIKKMYGDMRVPWDHTAQSTDIEELLRRVPGLTRREALRIQ
jgi:hypothetical protein